VCVYLQVILEESSAIGTSVVTVSASDADDNENARVTYSLTPSQYTSKFLINPTSGQYYIYTAAYICLSMGSSKIVYGSRGTLFKCLIIDSNVKADQRDIFLQKGFR